MSDTPTTDRVLYHLVVTGAFPEAVKHARRMERALREIRDMVEDDMDYGTDTGPNQAMNIVTLIDEALR